MFDSPPIFNAVQRKKCFQVTERLESILDKLKTPINTVGFLLSVGYFRAAKRFFGRQFHQQDVEYVARRLGYLPEVIDLEDYEKSVQSRHRKMILDYLGFREFDDEARQEVVKEIRTMVRSQMRPKNILIRVVDILEAKKTEIPSAYALTDLIVSEGRDHKLTMTADVDARLSDAQRELLDDLLEKHERSDDRDLKVQRFRLTLLKSISQSTKPMKIKQTVEDSRTLGKLYRQLQPLIGSLDLTQDGIRDYANSVIKSEIFQVARRSAEDRYLHLICFIAHQFLRIQDTLVEILLVAVQNSVNSCKREHKEKHYEEREARRQSLKAFVKCVDRGAFSPLAEIETIVFHNDLSDAEKVELIQGLLADRKEDRSTAVETLDAFKEQSRSPHDADYYDILESKSVKLQNRVAEIVKHIDLHAENELPLAAAIRNYKQCDGAVNQTSPAEFLTEQEQKLLVSGNGKFRVSLYKSLLFIAIADAIRSGALNLRDSYRHRSLDDYLIAKDAWKADREGYLDRADLTAFADCSRTLQVYAEILDKQYRHTNHRIIDGENPHFHLHKDGKFHVTTPKLDEDESDPVGLFPEKEYISLSEVLSTVGRLTGFLDEFQHSQIKYNAQSHRRGFFLPGSSATAVSSVRTRLRESQNQ